MSNLRRIVKNSAFEIATFGTRSISLIMVPVILARLSGAELLGEYVTVFSLAAVFAFIAGFGLPRLLTREIARLRDSKIHAARLVNASLGVVIILSLISIGLMFAIGTWMGYSTILMRALILAGIALGFESMTIVVLASFRGFEEMEWSWLVRLVSETVFLILLLIVVSLKARVDWLMTAYLISRIISLIVAAWLFWPRFGKLGLLLDTELWRTLIKMGFPFAINTGVMLARGRLGVIILAFLSGSVAVAMLEVATSLTLRINVLGRSVNNSLYPFLSSQFLKNVRSVPIYTAKGIRILLIPSVLIATLIWVFGQYLILFLYGEEFLGTVPALKLLALVIPLRFISNSLGTALTASNRQGKRSMAVAVAAVTNVLLNFILITRFQMMGAVYAIIFSEVVLFCMYIWHLKAEVYEMIAWRYFIAPGLGSLMILSISFLFNTLNIWVMFILSILLYLMAILAVDRSSVESLRQLLTGGWYGSDKTTGLEKRL